MPSISSKLYLDFDPIRGFEFVKKNKVKNIRSYYHLLNYLKENNSSSLKTKEVVSLIDNGFENFKRKASHPLNKIAIKIKLHFINPKFRKYYNLEFIEKEYLNLKRSLFLDSIRNSDIDSFKLLLNDPQIDPATKNNHALYTAIRQGHLEIVKLLLNDPQIDPATKNNHALHTAIRHGHLETVKLLLADSRINPFDDNQTAFRLALSRNNTEIIKLLIEDKRADPSYDNNAVLKWAIKTDNVEIVKLLLQDPRINSDSNDNWAIRWAAENGHVDIVKSLLQDSRIDPSVDNNWAIRSAAYYGHLAVIELLLSDPRVDPSAHNNQAIQVAAEKLIEEANSEYITLLAAYHNRLTIFKLLLSDPRVNLLDDKAILNWAIKSNQVEIIRLIIEKNPESPTLDELSILEWAKENNHIELVKLLAKVKIANFYKKLTTQGNLLSKLKRNRVASAKNDVNNEVSLVNSPELIQVEDLISKEKRLGVGSKSKVYEHKTEPSLVVKKFIKIKGEKPPKELAEHEYEIGKKLTYPHFVKIHNMYVGKSENKPEQYLIVMDKVNGKDISYYQANNQRIPNEVVCKLLSQASNSCFYLFNQQIGWRDINPGNITLTSEKNDLMLIDFEWWQEIPNYKDRAIQLLLGSMEIAGWLIECSSLLEDEKNSKMKKAIVFPKSFFGLNLTNEQIVSQFGARVHSKEKWMINIQKKWGKMNEDQIQKSLISYFNHVSLAFNKAIKARKIQKSPKPLT